MGGFVNALGWISLGCLAVWSAHTPLVLLVSRLTRRIERARREREDRVMNPVRRLYLRGSGGYSGVPFRPPEPIGLGRDMELAMLAGGCSAGEQVAVHRTVTVFRMPAGSVEVPRLDQRYVRTTEVYGPGCVVFRLDDEGENAPTTPPTLIDCPPDHDRVVLSGGEADGQCLALHRNMHTLNVPERLITGRGIVHQYTRTTKRDGHGRIVFRLNEKTMGF